MYWLEMCSLRESNPDLCTDLFAHGQWTAQRQGSHPFSSIAGDLCIEQTVNRDTKTTGGLTGITLNRGTITYTTFY